MRRATSTALLVSGLMVAGCAVLAACTGGTDEAAPETTPLGEGGAAGEADLIAFENPDADDFNLLLESSDDLIGSNPVAILNVEGTGGTELILSFEMGSHHCFGVRADAQESETDVVLEIKTGLLPGVDPASCRYGVYPYTTSVTLAEPLGERTISAAEEREPAADDGSADARTAEDEATEPAAEGTPEPEGESQTEAANPPAGGGGAMPVPLEQDGTTLTIDDASQLIGRHVEDGVEWAITNDVEWRVLFYDGEQVAEDSPLDTTRISFVVDSDLIVRFEWS
ncbi:MAG: hypothetical protein ACR2QO_13860 [Acidimicrobiales bacterium]